MTPPDLNHPRFPQRVVLAATGLTAPQLQTWANRGVLQLSEQNPGSGRRRLFSAADVACLAVLAELSHLNLDVGAARPIMEGLKRDLAEGGPDADLWLSRQARSQSERTFLVSSGVRYPHWSASYGPPDLTPHWQPVPGAMIAIPVGRIVQRALASLPADGG